MRWNRWSLRIDYGMMNQRRDMHSGFHQTIRWNPLSGPGRLRLPNTLLASVPDHLMSCLLNLECENRKVEKLSQGPPQDAGVHGHYINTRVAQVRYNTRLKRLTMLGDLSSRSNDHSGWPSLTSLELEWLASFWNTARTNFFLVPVQIWIFLVGCFKLVYSWLGWLEYNDNWNLSPWEYISCGFKSIRTRNIMN